MDGVYSLVLSPLGYTQKLDSTLAFYRLEIMWHVDFVGYPRESAILNLSFEPREEFG